MQTVEARGSGFIVNANGTIVTNKGEAVGATELREGEAKELLFWVSVSRQAAQQLFRYQTPPLHSKRARRPVADGRLGRDRALRAVND
jgi:hypothetical protein